MYMGPAVLLLRCTAQSTGCSHGYYRRMFQITSQIVVLASPLLDVIGGFMMQSDAILLGRPCRLTGCTVSHIKGAPMAGGWQSSSVASDQHLCLRAKLTYPARLRVRLKAVLNQHPNHSKPDAGRKRLARPFPLGKGSC